MNVEQLRWAMRLMWSVRWLRNRLGDAAMFFIVVWLYSLVGIGHKIPVVTALVLATLEFLCRDIFLGCVERVERLAPHIQQQRRTLALMRLLRHEARYHAQALWTIDIVHPIRMMIGLALGVLAAEIVPGVAGMIILVTVALYGFLGLNVTVVRGLLGRWRYATAVQRFKRRYRAT